jgi:hypothetical protein
MVDDRRQRAMRRLSKPEEVEVAHAEPIRFGQTYSVQCVEYATMVPWR